MALIDELETQYGLTPAVRSNIMNIQEQTGGSLIDQLESEYKLGGEQQLEAQPTVQPQQPGIYTGQVEAESPLTAGQRARLSFGDEEGIKQYLTSIGFEPTQDTEGNLLIKKGDKVYRLDEAGFSLKDIADMAGKSLPTGLSILGGIAGFLGAGPGGGGLLGALGGAIGETGRQAIGKALDVNAPGGGLGEITREAAIGGVSGLTAGVGNVLARGATRILPSLGTRVGGQVIPRLGTVLGGEAIESGLQGGIIRGGETFLETGDISKSLEQAKQGAIISAPFGPVGYAALRPLQPLIARSMANVGQKLSKVIPYETWSNPQNIKNPLMRRIVTSLSDAVVQAEAFGEAGQNLRRAAESHKMQEAMIGAVATDSVEKGSAMWNTLTSQEKNEVAHLFNITQKGYADLDKLMAEATTPKVKEAVKYMFNATQEVSSELQGRSYVDSSTKKIVRFANQPPRPFWPHIRELPEVNNYEKQVDLLVKRDYADLPKELALGKARKRADAMFENIKGVGKATARQLYNLETVEDYEKAGFMSNPFQAIEAWLKRNLKIAAYHRVFGDVLEQSTPPELIPASRVTTSGRIELEPGVISINDLSDTLKVAGYTEENINDLVYNVLMKQTRVGRSTTPGDTLAYFTDTNEVAQILNRELPKYGKIKEFTPEGKPILEEVAKPITGKPIFVLPKELAGAKPRYGYRDKLFQLKFESDIDKAAYITAQTTKSRKDAEYVKWLQDIYPDTPEVEIRRMGAKVRENIKNLAKESEDEILNISKILELPTKPKPVITEISPETAKGLKRVTTEELKPLVSVTKLPKAEPINIEDLEIEGGAEARTYESELTSAIRGKFDDVYKAIDAHYTTTINGKEVFDSQGANSAKKAIDHIFEIMDEKFTTNELASFAKTLGGLKFSLSFLRQPGQLLNNLLRGDMPSAWKGFRAIFNQLQPLSVGDIEIPQGVTVQRFVLESGAQQIPILDFGKNTTFQKFVNKVLWPLTKTEKGMMRVSSAITGANYAWNLAKIANLDPEVTPFRLYGLTPDEALDSLKSLLRRDLPIVDGKIKLDYTDLKTAAYWFTKDTQFGFDPLRLPYLVNTPMGSVAFQGKNFAWNQARLVFNSTVGELRAGNPGRATRNFAILMMLFPPLGYTIQAIINIITGKENETDITTVDGYLESIGDSGAMGLTVDLLQAPNGYMLLSNTLAGPAGGGIADVYNLLHGDMGIDDFLARQAGGGGRAIQNLSNIILGQ